ncbi:MAG: SDR family NAD(P)-dependent oxidoreductase [Tardiphaga sp.]
MKLALADINEEALAETKREVVAAGAEAMTLRWDLADLAATDDNVTAIETELGPVDVLVNNTGGPPPTAALGQKPELWSKFFESMVLSVIALTDRVVPGMRERKWGRVITSTRTLPCAVVRVYLSSVAHRVVTTVRVDYLPE